MLSQKIEKLRKLAQEVAQNSYSPYSKVKVGSALISHTGNYYTGTNIENASFGATVCAERVAIFNGISHGERGHFIESIYVYTLDGWPPCGMCRQVLVEFASPETIILIGDQAKTQTIITLNELFPHIFSFGQMDKIAKNDKTELKENLPR